MMNDLVIVGGLVPSLIVDQATLPQDVDAHVGTMDLDVGLQLALLDDGRYRKLTERLRGAGFAMDRNDDGNPTRQRWTITNSGTVTVDFLIPPSREGDRPGKLRDIEPVYSGQELTDRLSRAGFVNIKLFGDLDGAEYGVNAERLVAVTQKT